MLSIGTTGAYIDQTTHEVSLHELWEKKNCKEIVLRIVNTVCAMMNSNGGKIVVNINADTNISTSQLSSVIRIVEQHLMNFIATNITPSVNFKDSDDKKTITILVEKASSLITVNYHLFLPTQTQVVPWPPSQPQEKVKNEIINRNAIQDPVELESHQKLFLQNKESGLTESKTVQLKNVKADSSNRTKLADRMTGKSNKFDHYVSAFANYKGGHIYYGIDDDGIVKGELIEKEDDKTEITRKVEKSINKMIWPEKPKQKVHWEIFFEPVFDNNSTPIPSTFVIVIYIAPCLGGVFTEVPECYEMVEGEVVKMLFTTWKKRILRPFQLSGHHHPPIADLTMIRCTWGSSRIHRICSNADEQLVTALNKGKSIEVIANDLIKKNPGVIEVQLLILAKKVMAGYRSYSFESARKTLGEYETSLKKTTESWMFDAIRVYLETAMCVVQEDVTAINNILPNVLIQAKQIERGRISAALYALAAVCLLQQKGDDVTSPEKFAILALEDLGYIQDLPRVRADLEQKLHNILSLFYLGCNTFGLPTKKVIDLQKAECSIAKVHESIGDGNPMTLYRKVQFTLIQSILYYRKSKVYPERERHFLESALEISKDAQTLAIGFNFVDLEKWSQGCIALFTECLENTNVQEPCS